MKVTILTAGSRGDVEPYLSLGQGLRQQGCTVKLVATQNFAPLVASWGLDFAPIPLDLEIILNTPTARRAQQANTPWKFFRSLADPRVGEMMDLSLQHSWQACQGADVIVYHPGLPLGYFAARRLGARPVLASPFPLFASPLYPALVFDGWRGGGWLNRLSHWLFQQAFWWAIRPALVRFLRSHWGELPPDLGCPYRRPQTCLVSCSSTLFEHPLHRGFWFGQQPAWQPSPELLEFLQQGPAPVYVGFGSLSRPESLQQACESVLQAGQRAVVAGPLGALKEAAGSDLHVLDSCPHRWLFPRVAAVVHHGGAGTTAAALRAGVPMVVVPHANDQFAWARRAQELGVAPEELAPSQLPGGGLLRSLQQALQPSMAERARRLAATFKEEDGLAWAVQQIVGDPLRR